MISGVPVVISDTGENSDWIENDVNGILFESQNAKELATAIRTLLEDKAKLQDMGLRGRETILKFNDYKKEMAKVYECYKEIVNDRPEQ